MSKRKSGILVHPTSLPGPHGIGDLGPSAYHFVDWLQTAKQSAWQVLPLCPIGPGNSPYASVSAFAGSPLLVALEPLIEAGWLRPPSEDELRFDPRRVDFGRVIPWRMAKLREAAGAFFEGASEQQRASFEDYVRAQADWLEDYALFMVLDAHHQAERGEFVSWPQWEPGLAQREAAALARARERFAEQLGFWRFVQYCFDTQWASLKAYANARGIELIGDLPIFVAAHGADCWSRPELYRLDEQLQPAVIAGVPPDFFSETGQRWGNPLYDWDAMHADGYAWWVARMRRQLALADIVRIDHFRGFAAYWEIPVDCPTAVDGKWVPGPGAALFEALEQALGELPVIAEDLGVITEDVEALRDRFELPGMKIVQFGFSEGPSHAFLPHNYPSNCVVYTGTHDNNTVRGWYAEAPDHERDFARAYLHTDEHGLHWAMIRAVMASVADTALFPFQDVLGLDATHRMNTPGQTECWTWRFDWDMVGAEPASNLAHLTELYGRSPSDLPTAS